MPTRRYFYTGQISRYLIQFMAIFSGLQVKTGKRPVTKTVTEPGCEPTPVTENTEVFIDVPVHYGSRDRVASAIMNENTQNRPLRLPLMAAYMTAIALAPDRRKGVSTERVKTFVPRGGLIPDDVQVIHQYMPVPYDLTVELCIYSSNQNQQLQILEQILPIFDPDAQIQISDAEFDWTKITVLQLESIRLEENYPAATDRRMIITTLSFHIPIWVSAPGLLRQDFVKDIWLRIGAVANIENAEQILEELEEDMAEYRLVASVDDIGEE